MAKILTLGSENRPDDGKFEVIRIPAGHKWQVMKRMAQAAATHLDADQRVSDYSFQTIKKMPMQCDGEVMALEAGSNVLVESCHKVLRTII